MRMRKISAFLVVVLMLIALFVAVNLTIGNGPKWYAIGLYWWVLTMKNLADWLSSKSA